MILYLFESLCFVDPCNYVFLNFPMFYDSFGINIVGNLVFNNSLFLLLILNFYVTIVNVYLLVQSNMDDYEFHRSLGETCLDLFSGIGFKYTVDAVSSMYDILSSYMIKLCLTLNNHIVVSITIITNSKLFIIIASFLSLFVFLYLLYL